MGGILSIEAPRAEERAALQRVLHMDRVDLAVTTAPKHTADYASTPWPAHQDRMLMQMANHRIEQGDICAALVLIKWAAVTIDTTKHSLTYQKPKLAAKISKLQLQVNRWMVRNAAYLPLLKS